MEFKTLIKEMTKSLIITFIVILIIITIRMIWASKNDVTLPLFDSFIASAIIIGHIISDLFEQIRKNTLYNFKYTIINIIVISCIFYLILTIFY